MNNLNDQLNHMYNPKQMLNMCAQKPAPTLESLQAECTSTQREIERLTSKVNNLEYELSTTNKNLYLIGGFAMLYVFIKSFL